MNVITCEVLIAGGGPAGSACAWKLRQAGVDVLVIDKATFPRDKVCAGWITPGAVRALEIDTDDYSNGRTFQPITAFRIGLIGNRRAVDVHYDHAVSFGIRRCEFDQYLLQRSKARLLLGTPLTAVRRDREHWVVNETIRASMLIGAGGHFCPVARLLNGDSRPAPLVVAQEAEFTIGRDDRWLVAEERPELYFCRDLQGYGWCFRKQDYVNIGFGRFDARGLPQASAAFVDYLKSRGRIPADASWRWRGHAYFVSNGACRKAVDDGLMLVGDAAGIADPRSGEGILPAIASGLAAASAILQARGGYTRGSLAPYARYLTPRSSGGLAGRLLSALSRAAVPAAAGRLSMRSPWFVRHVVLDRWFLHASTVVTAGAHARGEASVQRC